MKVSRKPCPFRSEFNEELTASAIVAAAKELGVYRSSSETVAAERARWLGELAKAIDEAQRLAWRLGFVEGPNPEAMELYERLETARVEVESLRHSGWSLRSEAISPEWINILPQSLHPVPEG